MTAGGVAQLMIKPNDQATGAQAPPRDRRVDDDRLVRMEAKIDSMSESLLTLVRMEERQMFQAQTIERLEQEVAKERTERESIRVEINDLKAKGTTRDDRSLVYERIVWFIITVGLGYFGLTNGAVGPL